MKTLINLSIRQSALMCTFFLFILISFSAKSQDCSTTIPTTNVCSTTISEFFSASNGSFSTTSSSASITWSSSDGDLRNQIALFPSGSNTVTFLSASYYKTATQPNTVNAGFKFSWGSKISLITSVKLDIINSSDLSIIASCSNFSGGTNGGTFCTGITSTSISPGLLFKYKFTITFNCDGNGSFANNFIAFDNFSYGGTSNAPLPVEFGEFSTNRISNSDVALKWSTLSELNNTGFDIQRRLNDKDEFESIGFVKSKSLFGNSDSKLDYEFFDKNNSVSTSYYRIKQVDIDGKSKYTPIRLVDGVKTKTNSLVYPNPAKSGNATIAFNNNNAKNIFITDMSGRQIESYKSYSDHELKPGKLKPGMYLISIQNIQSGEREVQRLIIAE